MATRAAWIYKLNVTKDCADAIMSFKLTGDKYDEINIIKVSVLVYTSQIS